jgi:recombination protein RecT
MSTDTVTEATSKAVATRSTGGHAIVAQYAPDLKQVMPSHINRDQWIRLAQGALKKGRKVKAPDGVMRTELEIAAISNVGVFMSELINAARLGLEPGTEQFYLTSRKVKGQPEILGIVGYQGYIELMYRAGAISSVVAECVYRNDSFEYTPGVDERPVHRIDWDLEDRGELRLVYAYAIMKDKATSKVVVLNAAAIASIKKSANGTDSQYSPWNTHPAAMWLKSAVRQLAKWVPTSAEYIREQLRAQRDVAAEGQFAPNLTGLPEIPLDADIEHDDGQVIDAEVLDDEAAWAADVTGE